MTQTDQILSALKAGRHITPMDALRSSRVFASALASTN